MYTKFRVLFSRNDTNPMAVKKSLVFSICQLRVSVKDSNSSADTSQLCEVLIRNVKDSFARAQLVTQTRRFRVDTKVTKCKKIETNYIDILFACIEVFYLNENSLGRISNLLGP